MKPFESFLAPQMQKFIAYRKHLGYQISRSKSHLKTLDRYLNEQKIENSLLSPSFFLQLRSDLKIEPRSVNAIISSLRVFFQFLIRKGIYAQNPLQDIPELPEYDNIPFIFAPQQTDQLLAAVCKRLRQTKRYFLKDLSQYMAILLMARCGLRISEPIRLKRHHYRPKEKTLYIEKTKFKKDRLIPLPMTVATEMQNYLALRDAWLVEQQNPFLLAGCKQKGLNDNTLRNHFHRAVQDIGLKQPRQIIGKMTFSAPTPHSLRHGFAIATLNAVKIRGGCPQNALPVLAAYMGHREYRYTTQYLKVLDAKQRQQLFYFAKSQKRAQMKLAACIYQFFDQYLIRIKGSSDQTVKAYRDAFGLFLPFAADHLGIKIKSLQMEHLSADLILAFLDHLESDRNNSSITRNHRLAAIKSLAKMIRLMYPQNRKLAETILAIPQKRTTKQLIGFLYPDETLKVFQRVELTKKNGFRNYTILHLLDDSGARASEIATLKLDYFDPHNATLGILGKGDRYRQITLESKTVQLIELYIAKYRTTPKRLYQHYLFINQRRTHITRHGIYRICKKYLYRTLSPKRLKDINPVHSFRHSCAVRMLSCGKSLSDIKNRLGHENIESTMIYLHLDLKRKKQLQKAFIEYTKSNLSDDLKINELIDWENRKDILEWLDSL